MLEIQSYFLTKSSAFVIQWLKSLESIRHLRKMPIAHCDWISRGDVCDKPLRVYAKEKHQPFSTPKSAFETVTIDNKAKTSIYTYQFFTAKFSLFHIGKTNAPIRQLTSPHIVIIICSYLIGFNLNLSDATLTSTYTNQMFDKNSLGKQFLCFSIFGTELIILFWAFS